MQNRFQGAKGSFCFVLKETRGLPLPFPLFLQDKSYNEYIKQQSHTVATTLQATTKTTKTDI